MKLAHIVHITHYCDLQWIFKFLGVDVSISYYKHAYFLAKDHIQKSVPVPLNFQEKNYAKQMIFIKS